MTEQIPTILQKIIATKVEEVAIRKKQLSIDNLQELITNSNIAPRGFYSNLATKIKHGNAIIAEIKKASPSKGIICQNFNPEKIAKSYEQYGATCLSVLTDKQYFQGSEDYLQQARLAVKLPVLRKDFIIDEYQVFESKAIGADCILLIAACLSHDAMKHFINLANELQLDVLVEVHSLEEIEKVADLPIKMIGINNRNLHDFKVSLSICIDLQNHLPKDVLVVAESGITNKQDIKLINESGIKAFLIGETFMKYDNPGEKLHELFSK